MAAAHISRALLLKENVFPLSRPEMPAQLEEISFFNDAKVLKNLIEGTGNISELEKIAGNIDKRVTELEEISGKKCDCKIIV